MTFSYQGSELQIFAGARIWKRYFSAFIKPYIKGHILEVGSGLGGTTPWLINANVKSCLCLEPDPELVNRMAAAFSGTSLVSRCTTKTGTLRDIPQDQLFDTILYIDVIEHIGDDIQELDLAARHLSPGGHLIILVPCNAWLYSDFDRQVGHFRRYNRNSLKNIIPRDLLLARLINLDSAGFLISVIQKFMLNKAIPSHWQVALWDKVFVPISWITDILSGYSFGRSLAGVWKKGTREDAPLIKNSQSR